MSQLRETKCLTTEQIDTIIHNWSKILGAHSITTLYKGKPVFSTENINQWNLPRLTKFAENYVLYELDVKNGPNLYLITIETDKFDKVNIQACIWFYHFFSDKVYKTQNTRPEVFICPAFVVTDAMFHHVPVNIIPCIYRFVPLPTIYPMVGSKNTLFSSTWDYKRLELEEIQGTREYSLMLDSDPLVKILNALPGDTIQYKRVLFEGSPYTEYYRRTVQSTVTDVNIIAPSGVCYGKIQGKVVETREDDDKPTKTTGGMKMGGKNIKNIKTASKSSNGSSGRKVTFK